MWLIGPIKAAFRVDYIMTFKWIIVALVRMALRKCFRRSEMADDDNDEKMLEKKRQEGRFVMEWWC